MPETSILCWQSDRPANDCQPDLRNPIAIFAFGINWVQQMTKAVLGPTILLIIVLTLFEQRNGNCRLMSSLATRLAETAQTWGRAIAPIAEWVAQALWNSPLKSANKKHFVPTRLTQRRGSEGRGKKYTAQANPVPRQVKICDLCGAEGVKSRYCPLCAVEVARENMAQVALIGHAKSRTPTVKAHISKTLSNHAVANSWWSPSSLPAWLNEECYGQKIQPRLRTIKVREISEAMKVSRPYAALVRAGRRRPHPRHWEVLAKLVGVSAEMRP